MTGPKYSANLFIASLDFKENQMSWLNIKDNGNGSLLKRIVLCSIETADNITDIT